MELKIRTIEQIKEEIHGENKKNAKIKHFPESINFPFNELYKEIVTNHNIIYGFSNHCNLLSLDKAISVTKEYHEIIGENNFNEIIKNYWFFGTWTDDDYWIMDKKGKIYYWEYDFNYNKNVYTQKYSLESMVDVNINFIQWLQFAFLDKDNDEKMDEYGSYGFDNDEGFDEIMIDYCKKLSEISKELSELRWKMYDENHW
jgi:hypothetical protein